MPRTRLPRPSILTLALGIAQDEVVSDEMRLAPLMFNPGETAVHGGVFQRALASLQVFDDATRLALATIGTEGSLRLHAEIVPLRVSPIGGTF